MSANPIKMNLPGDSMGWGRDISHQESRLAEVSNLARSRTYLQGRSAAGKLSVLANQVNGLSNMRVLRATAPNVSVTGNNTNFPVSSTTLTFPAPDISGSALLEVYGWWNAVGNFGNVTVRSRIQYLGRMLVWFDGAPYDGAISGWGKPFKFKALSRVPVTEGVAPSFTIDLARYGFTSTTTTETLYDIEGYLTVVPPEQVIE